MTTDEAIARCEAWFRHLEQQQERAEQLQAAARLARQGHEEDARKILNQIDRQPKVFDGAALAPAVRHLLEVVQRSNDV